MGSNGEGSHDERSLVTLQIQLMDRSKISVQTNLDVTVEEFKLVLADRTGVPLNDQWLVHMGRILRNPKTLRSYELDLDQSIHLVCSAPSSPSISHGSMPIESTLYRILPCFSNRDAIASIIKDIPFLNWLAQSPNWAKALEHPNMLHNVLLYRLCYTINGCLACLKADVTDNIKADTEGSHNFKMVVCVYDVQFGIPVGTEENQLSLGLLGLSLVDTSDSEPESSNARQSDLATNRTPFSGSDSSNANQSELAPNGDLLSGPENSNANLSEWALNTEPLPNPWAPSSYRGASSSQMGQVPDSDDELVGLSYWQKVYQRSVDILVPIILSDATLLRHCKEQGESVDRAYAAYAALLESDNMNQDLYDSAFVNLVIEVDVYFRHILKKFHPLQYNADYGSGASNDDSTGVTPEVVAPDEVFASQLAAMEQMGFMDRRENIRTLFLFWGDVEKAIEWHNSRKAKC